MSYCPKCGNKVDETMAFCPRCGNSLKATVPPSQPMPPPAYQRRDEKSEKNEKQEKNQHNEKKEKQEKGEFGFIGFLIGGLVLITLGVFAFLNITNPGYLSGQGWAIMLLIIGVIIIIAAIYLSTMARRHFPQT